MKKSVLIVFLSVWFTSTIKSQFVSQFSQYMFSKETYNPAALSQYNMITMNGIYKLQWVGIKDAPVDAVFHASIPWSFHHQNGNIGIALDNESMGLLTKQEATVQATYNFSLGSGTVSIGLNLGAVKVGFKGDSVHIPTGVFGNDYHIAATSDPLIPTSQVNGMAFNAGIGLFYSTPSFYVGASGLNLTNPTIHWSSTQSTYIGSMYYFMGGYNISTANPLIKIKPSILVKTNFIHVQEDIDLLVDYKNKFWGGLGYRPGDAFIINGGVHLDNGLTFGYAFDLPTTALGGSSFGSHELMVSYQFKLSLSKRHNKYKSVRIL
ncbi:MAG: PorP/SprF family type IX secretion system membrane protein [Microbacter sp.]